MKRKPQSFARKLSADWPRKQLACVTYRTEGLRTAKCADRESRAACSACGSGACDKLIAEPADACTKPQFCLIPTPAAAEKRDARTEPCHRHHPVGRRSHRTHGLPLQPGSDRQRPLCGGGRQRHRFCLRRRWHDPRRHSRIGRHAGRARHSSFRHRQRARPRPWNSASAPAPRLKSRSRANPPHPSRPRRVRGFHRQTCRPLFYRRRRNRRRRPPLLQVDAAAQEPLAAWPPTTSKRGSCGRRTACGASKSNIPTAAATRQRAC